MIRAMDYCTKTKDTGLAHGLEFEDGNEIYVEGISESDFSKDLETRRSIEILSMKLMRLQR